jgi:hypothetical protein
MGCIAVLVGALGIVTEVAAANNSSLAPLIRFVEQTQVELNLEHGGATMFTLDIPDVPQHYASAVIAQASQVEKAVPNRERAMGVCFGVDYNQIGQEYAADGLSPEYAAATYFKLYENRTVNQPPSSNVELVEPPKHGKVVYSKFEDGSLNHQYIPDPGYVGDEKIVFKVNVDGTTVKLAYLLKVTKVVTGGQVSDDVFCKKTGTQWKISSINNDPTDQLSLFNSPTQLTSYLAGAINTNINIADLTDGALGQTTGTTITLDTNAAGNNWFIDVTPADNSEFLPTSNPYEWVAKEGSAAYGKMDMLSVLLHEYGHALGIAIKGARLELFYRDRDGGGG